MIRITIADPDPATRKAITLLLQHEMEMDGIVEVGDMGALTTSLAEQSPELLLLDWSLSASPATDTCRLLQKAYPPLKIILLSVNAENEAAAREAGADFIHKGASPDELIATLELLLRKDK